MSNIHLILSGGVNDDGSLPIWVQDRASAALAAYETGDIFLVSSSYSLNRKPVMMNGQILYENQAISNFIIDHNIDPKNILLESSSHDTIGSAIFSITMIQQLCNDNEKVIVYSSNWHMPRVQTIFKHVAKVLQFSSKLSFVSVESKINFSDRMDRELASHEKYKREWYPLENPRALFMKLYFEHDCYNHLRQSRFSATPRFLY